MGLACCDWSPTPPGGPGGERLPATSRRVRQESRQIVRKQLTYMGALAAARIPADPPPWAQAPPAPLVLARHGLDKIRASEEGAARSVAIVVALYCAWWVASTPRTAVLLWLAAVGYGLTVVWTCHAGQSPWRWTRTYAAAATGLVFAAGLGLLVAGYPVLATVLAVAAAQGFAHRPEETSVSGAWWSEPRMREDWKDAGLVKADVPVWFRRPHGGRPALDDSGAEALTVVPVVGPKPGRSLAVTIDKTGKDRLEKIMGLRAGQLHVHHDDDDEAAAYTLTVTAVSKRAVAIAQMPDTWDYNQPLFIGNDHLGRPHYRRTWGCHSGFVAMTQKGKTAAALYDVAHAALDPTIPIYLLDFKGDQKDFSPLLPLCKRSVTGASLTTARQALGILEELEALSESRKNLSPDEPGVLVVVDEWFRILSLAQRLDSDLGKKLDGLLTELMATAASRRIKFESLFQGGTSDYINKPMRINIGQRFCGVTESTEEVRYFLESKPAQLPKAPGQFLFKDDGVGPVLITHPYLDPAGFAEVCRRAAVLRSGAVPAATDPLESAVRELLRVEPMRAKTLLDLLPDDLKPRNSKGDATPQALGYAVKRMSGIGKTTVGPKADPAYELTKASAAREKINV